MGKMGAFPSYCSHKPLPPALFHLAPGDASWKVAVLGAEYPQCGDLVVGCKYGLCPALISVLYAQPTPWDFHVQGGSQCGSPPSPLPLLTLPLSMRRPGGQWTEPGRGGWSLGGGRSWAREGGAYAVVGGAGQRWEELGQWWGDSHRSCPGCSCGCPHTSAEPVLDEGLLPRPGLAAEGNGGG